MFFKKFSGSSECLRIAQLRRSFLVNCLPKNNLEFLFKCSDTAEKFTPCARIVFFIGSRSLWNARTRARCSSNLCRRNCFSLRLMESRNVTGVVTCHRLIAPTPHRALFCASSVVVPLFQYRLLTYVPSPIE